MKYITNKFLMKNKSLYKINHCLCFSCLTSLNYEFFQIADAKKKNFHSSQHRRHYILLEDCKGSIIGCYRLQYIDITKIWNGNMQLFFLRLHNSIDLSDRFNFILFKIIGQIISVKTCVRPFFSCSLICQLAVSTTYLDKLPKQVINGGS